MKSTFLPILISASSALAAGTVLSLTQEQVSSVFPDTAGLKFGQAKAAKSYDLEIVANTSHALVVLTAIDSGNGIDDAATMGWFSVGTGIGMTDSDDMIMWQYDDEWSISHREVKTAYVEPKDAGPSNDDFAIVPMLSSASSAKVAKAAFIRKLEPSYAAKNAVWDLSAPLELVFARSSKKPTSGEADATLAFHDVNMASVVYALSILGYSSC